MYYTPSKFLQVPSCQALSIVLSVEMPQVELLTQVPARETPGLLALFVALASSRARWSPVAWPF